MTKKNSRAAKIVEFEEEKLWFQKDGNILTIGITQKGLEELGEAEDVNLPSLEEEYDQDDAIAELDGTEGSLKIFTPAGGIVLEVNEALGDDINILNEDPIDEGWLVKIEIQDENQLKNYL